MAFAKLNSELRCPNNPSLGRLGWLLHSHIRHHDIQCGGALALALKSCNHISMNIEGGAEAFALLAHHKAAFCLGSALTEICGNNPSMVIHVSIHCIPCLLGGLFCMTWLQFTQCNAASNEGMMRPTGEEIHGFVGFSLM